MDLRGLIGIARAWRAHHERDPDVLVPLVRGYAAQEPEPRRSARFRRAARRPALAWAHGRHSTSPIRPGAAPSATCCALRRAGRARRGLLAMYGAAEALSATSRRPRRGRQPLARHQGLDDRGAPASRRWSARLQLLRGKRLDLLQCTTWSTCRRLKTLRREGRRPYPLSRRDPLQRERPRRARAHHAPSRSIRAADYSLAEPRLTGCCPGANRGIAVLVNARSPRVRSFPRGAATCSWRGKSTARRGATLFK